jgi:predicted aldo/keto reductase-like oxidoreductase
MQRREFLQATAVAAAVATSLAADSPMPYVKLGRSGMNVSRFTLGGYHMRVGGEEAAIKIIHRAVELGVTLFDSANLYHKGASDETYGKAFEGGMRSKVLLMTKCDIYSKDGARDILEQQLKRMKTDYLDLWVCHQVSKQSEVDQILGPNGSLETLVKAKREGKVRHIGFSGHHDPLVHLRLLNSTSEWETVQMPINLVDPHYLSFIENVLPIARQKGLGVLAMKSNAMGQISKNQVASIEECIRFTLSQDVDTLVSGVETLEQLEANVNTVKTLKKLSRAELSSLLERTGHGPTGTKIENYKKNPNEALNRFAHRDGDPA